VEAATVTEMPAMTQPTRATSLELRGIGKRFPAHGGGAAVLAVEAVDLLARPGEFVTLIGPSGCGKSTVFNLVAGLEQPTGGEIRIGGQPLADRLGASAYMPQRDALLPWRRVIDNVTLLLELRGVSRREARRTAQPLLDRFGLGDFARAWPWQLSGGMRQRVAFARTLLSGRPLLCLDEPFGALDAITRIELQSWLADALTREPRTVVLVTHDVEEAIVLADRLLVLSRRPGRIVAEFPVDLTRPRSRTGPALVGLRAAVLEALR
jgi:putative hydroxymethylpyrimidine transport system ATP-binding protein